MTDLSAQLSLLYLRLGSGVLLGWILGRILPPSVPARLGQFLFWVAVPFSVVAFLRRAELSGAIALAPAIAWAAIGLSIGLALLWLKFDPQVQSKGLKPHLRAFQGSFIINSMVGNTGYLGYPIVLSLLGEKYFAWALFYDLGGTLFGAYGLGVLIAARFGRARGDARAWFEPLLNNPTLWSFGFGLGFRLLPLPEPAEQTLQTLAWATVTLSLVLMGMRLSQIRAWNNLPSVAASLAIKMMLVPAAVALLLPLLSLSSQERLALILQMGMPPAFASLVIAEAYDLDREQAVTAIAFGTVALLVTLPLWLLLFARA